MSDDFAEKLCADLKVDPNAKISYKRAIEIIDIVAQETVQAAAETVRRALTEQTRIGLELSDDGILTASLCFDSVELARTFTQSASVAMASYRGVWDPTVSYAVGDQATHAGGLWVARAACLGRTPGRGDGAWRLVVKSGHAGSASV